MKRYQGSLFLILVLFSFIVERKFRSIHMYYYDEPGPGFCLFIWGTISWWVVGNFIKFLNEKRNLFGMIMGILVYGFFALGFVLNVLILLFLSIRMLMGMGYG